MSESHENFGMVEIPKKNEAVVGSFSQEASEQIEGIFSELLDVVKYAPETQKKAMELLIGQMQQIGEQLKHVRDAKNFQELKILMLKHWTELRELTKDSPELFDAIQGWGKKFIESKKLYYDYIFEIKDELIDHAQQINTQWTSIQVDLAKIFANLGSDSRRTKFEFDHKMGTGDYSLGGGPVTKLYTSLIETANGFETDDFDIESASTIAMELSNLIASLNKDSYTPDYTKKRPIDLYPELVGMLSALEGKINDFSKRINETSKTMKLVKKVHDTHFLDLYNEQA